MGDRGEGVMRSRCGVEVDSEADFLSQQRSEGGRSRNQARGRSENEVIVIQFLPVSSPWRVGANK